MLRKSDYEERILKEIRKLPIAKLVLKKEKQMEKERPGFQKAN